jgi:hypothetical protein
MTTYVTYQQKQQEIKDFCIERLKEIAEYDQVDFKNACPFTDLHNDVFNTDYYIIGRYQAKQWMGADAFDMIGDVVEYEKNNFGELHTDISEPERVVNMWVYIQGENIIQECYEEVCDSLDNQCKLDVG